MSNVLIEVESEGISSLGRAAHLYRLSGRHQSVRRPGCSNDGKSGCCREDDSTSEVDYRASNGLCAKDHGFGLVSIISMDKYTIARIPPVDARALLNVCNRMATSCWTPSMHTSPLPCGPITPVEWASST